MRISELLTAVAKWLENPNSEMYLLAEYHDESLAKVAEGCIGAANILRKVANEVEELEPIEQRELTSDAIESIAALAEVLDNSGDVELQKQASVLDELLLTIASDKDAMKAQKLRDENRLEDLKKKYHAAKEALDKINKVSEIEKDIKDSGMTKEYRILEAPLSSRYCPDHSGTMTTRVGDNQVQCPLDGKVYDFSAGMQLMSGEKVPGTSVSEQTKMDGSYESAYSANYDDRVQRLQSNR